MTALAQKIKETPMAPYLGLLQSMNRSQKLVLMAYLVDSIQEIEEETAESAPIENEANTQEHRPLKLAGCWANDAEGEDMYQFMRHVRDNASNREINLYD